MLRAFITFNLGLLKMPAGVKVWLLGHILWVPLLGYLWQSLQGHPFDTGMGLWLRVLMVLNTISLGIDTIDLIRYLRGDRGELV